MGIMKTKTCDSWVLMAPNGEFYAREDDRGKCYCARYTRPDILEAFLFYERERAESIVGSADKILKVVQSVTYNEA